MPNLFGVLERATESCTIEETVNDEGNLVVIMGHLGRDPEFRTVGSGKALAKFSVAVSWGKRGEPDQKTEWVVCQAWEETADLLRDFVKGQAILVIGKPGVRTYQDKQYGEVTVWHVARPVYQQRQAQTTQSNSQDTDVPF